MTSVPTIAAEPPDYKTSRKSHPRQFQVPFLPLFCTLPHNMSRKVAIPDAWEDDWEAQADKAEAAPEPAKAEKEPKISKAERLAKHAESNKKIWESAYVRPSLYSCTQKLKSNLGKPRRPFIS